MRSIGSVVSHENFYAVMGAAIKIISDWRARKWVGGPVTKLEQDRVEMCETIQLCMDYTYGVPLEDKDELVECRDFLYCMRYTEECWQKKCNGEWIKAILKVDYDVPLPTVVESMEFVRGC